MLKKHYQSCFSCEKSRCPIALVSIELPPDKVDVNLEPNKTKILLHEKVRIIIVVVSFDVSLIRHNRIRAYVVYVNHQ